MFSRKLAMPGISILFGSQTGYAEDIARRIFRQGKRRQLDMKISPLDNFNFTQNLPVINLAIFVISTAGQGELPSNATHFWRFLLRKSLPANFLSSMQFGVLGLGDSSFPKFNFGAKKLFRRLLQLGARNFCETGLADDQHEFGCDSVADLWISDLWVKLSAILKFENVEKITGALPPMFEIILEKNFNEEYEIEMKTNPLSLFEGDFSIIYCQLSFLINLFLAH